MHVLITGKTHYDCTIEMKRGEIRLSIYVAGACTAWMHVSRKVETCLIVIWSNLPGKQSDTKPENC